LRDLSSISRQDRKVKAELNGYTCETSFAVQGIFSAKDLHYLHSHGCGDVFEKYSSKPKFNERFGDRCTHGG
jgi:hypothetical protein